MKISYNWLKDYIQLDMEPERLGEILTSTGLEVSGIEKVESIKGGLHGVVAGKVLTCGKHPNADRLSLCTVDVGSGEPLQIVCGAPNVAEGQTVWVATMGTTLYPINSEEPFNIAKAKVRGEVSHGMICAEDELGLGEDHDGIMVLPDDIAVGTKANDYYEVSTDHVIDIDLTPNRSDATSHIGVAKDLAAYLRVNGHPEIGYKMPGHAVEIPEGVGSPINVDVLNSEACPRYAGLVIDNIEVGESPRWMQERLRAIGVRPINNVVDITNYVLHEMGQPLHAFDAEKIAGQGVVVDTLEPGSKFITLDEVERTLTDHDLMICNAERGGMCIAGVFGGIGTGVTETTTRIFLESAHFHPEWIRKTSMHHLLRTDAARTFEKTTDPAICVDVMLRAASLLAEYAGGKVVSEVIDIYPEPIARAEVDIRLSQVNRLSGLDLSRDKVVEILDAMEIEILSENGDDMRVAIPTNKADVTREADVIEEILRIFGYDQVPVHHKMEVGLASVSGVTLHGMRNILGSFLSAQGFNEMMGLSLSEDANLETGAFGIGEDQRVLIQNTSNIGMNTMRPDLIVSALEAVRYNQNRNQEDFRFYEFGHGYIKNGKEINETEYLSLVLVGSEWPQNWAAHNASSDFYTLKKYVDGIVSRTGLKKIRTSEADDSRFNYGLDYKVKGVNVVSFGLLNKKLLKDFDIRHDVYLAQFDVQALYKAMVDVSIVYDEISKYPAVSRDLAFVIKEDVTYDQVAKVVKQSGGHLLKSVDLFDIYKNEKQLGAGNKSYAIQMTYEDPKKTLTDAEVDKVVKQIVTKVEQDLGGVLRG